MNDITKQLNKWILLDNSMVSITPNEVTEERAEALRAANSIEYYCVTLKRKATDLEVLGYKISRCWNHPNFNNKIPYFCCCGECVDSVYQGDV